VIQVCSTLPNGNCGVSLIMKKSLLITAGFFASLQLHGQGTVFFSNIPNQIIHAPVIDSTTGTNAVAGTTFSVALYWSPYGPTSLTAPDQPFTQVGQSVHLGFPPAWSVGSGAGYYWGGTVYALGIVPGGGLGWFQVKAWETAYGTSYEQAAAAGPMNGRTALLGVSNSILVKTGSNAGFPTAPGNLAGISPILLTVVPEPSVVALGALSICVLLVFLPKKPTAAQ
jgi:hypothetical protein